MVALAPNNVGTVEERIWARLNDSRVEFLGSADSIVTSLEMTDGLWAELGALSKAKHILSHICSRLNAADLGCHDRETRVKIDRVREKACVLMTHFHVMSLMG